MDGASKEETEAVNSFGDFPSSVWNQYIFGRVFSKVRDYDATWVFYKILFYPSR